MKCEWCGMSYPDGGWDCYYYLELFEHDFHIICSYCHAHLKKAVYEKDIIRFQKVDRKMSRATGKSMKKKYPRNIKHHAEEKHNYYDIDQIESLIGE